MTKSASMRILNTKQDIRISYDGRLFKREEFNDLSTNNKEVQWSMVSHTGDDVIYTPVNVMDSYSETVLEFRYQKLNDEST
jgi:hypothetical protein